MKPRTKGDSYAIHRPDAGLINSDPVLSNFLTHFSLPRFALQIYLAFRSLVIHGKVSRVTLANTVLLFVYVCACEGRTEIAPRDIAKYCSMHPQVARDILARSLRHGYLRRVRIGVYTLTDSGRELYATLIDSITTELTGPFRWRP